jgi:hypothetical protein
MQGGVWRDGADHSYSASIIEQGDPEPTHFLNYLETRCSSQAAEIVDWIATDWAFERPWRPPDPIDAGRERKRLLRIHEGLKARAGLPVINDVKFDERLLPASAAAVRADLAGLRAERIRAAFPSDPRGRLAVKSTVLLAAYEAAETAPKDRELCLVLRGPLRRSDPQEIRAVLEWLIPQNQDHCWVRERWHWHDNGMAESATRWGAPVPVEDLAANRLTIRELTKRVTADPDDSRSRSALAMLLQESGKLLESLELYGVEIDGDLKRLCGGQKIYPPACCAHADEKWMDRLREWMRACAPWKLAEAARQESRRIAEWAAKKKGRKPRQPLLKLLIFPGQHHLRKACLVLTSRDLEGNNPRLEIQATASNARLHESAWKRPLEIDLARHMLVS